MLPLFTGRSLLGGAFNTGLNNLIISFHSVNVSFTPTLILFFCPCFYKSFINV